MTLDHLDERRNNRDRRGRNRCGGKQQQQQQEDKHQGATDSTKPEKPKRPVSCFICSGPHFANKCPEHKQSAKRDESSDEEERHAHMTWEVSMFTTYLEKQVNAIGYSGFQEAEVLLDNQADISIMKPGLLHAFKPAEKKVRVNRV